MSGHGIRFVLTFAAAIILAGLPEPTAAGKGGTTMMGGYGETGAGLSVETTAAVVKILVDGGKDCSGLPRVYRYDCYRYVYRQAARILFGIQAYREAVKALQIVEDRLKRQVALNLDKSAKPIRRGFVRFRAIKSSAVPKVKAAAVSSMKEAETVLLRSDPKKQLHYTRIAAAIHSHKVLLRSALMLVPGLGIVVALLVA